MGSYSFQGQEPTVFPFAWQSNRTILFYLHPKLCLWDSIWHQSPETEFLASISNPSAIVKSGLPRCTSGEESGCRCRRHGRCGLDPWVGKIPWRRAWQPTPVFLPGASYGRQSLTGSLHRVAELSTTEATWHTRKPIFSSTCLCLFPRLSQVTCSNWFPCLQSVLHYLVSFFHCV